ncbi:hypothetical protein D3C81_1613570 [compost metagenome]
MMVSTGALRPQIYISVAYGTSLPVMRRAVSNMIWSANGRLSLSPSKPRMMRAGESSSPRSKLLAVCTRPLMRQRQFSCDSSKGSISTFCIRPDAADTARACSTVLPSSSTSLYSVSFLVRLMIIGSQRSGKPPLALTENGRICPSGVCAAELPDCGNCAQAVSRDSKMSVESNFISI